MPNTTEPLPRPSALTVSLILSALLFSASTFPSQESQPKVPLQVVSHPFPAAPAQKVPHPSPPSLLVPKMTPPTASEDIWTWEFLSPSALLHRLDPLLNGLGNASRRADKVSTKGSFDDGDSTMTTTTCPQTLGQHVGSEIGVGESEKGTPEPTIEHVVKEETLFRFLHGVASGDPLHDRVILWTVLTPPKWYLSLPSPPPIRVIYTLSLSANSTDPSLPGDPTVSLGKDVVLEGETWAKPEGAWSVKVDVGGLVPKTTYHYQFSVDSPHPPSTQNHQKQNNITLSETSPQTTLVSSPAGRTWTLPHPTDPHFSSINLGIVSCSNYPSGFFNAYAGLAARAEVDLIVHLGDYIYEYQNGEFGDGTRIERIAEPRWALKSLEDFRERHAFYKLDPDLQALHRVKPWIVVWDDHEFYDNIAGPNETQTTDPAKQAYFEYLPIRNPNPETPIYRSFQIGKLVDMLMLDTRIHGRDPTDTRDPQIINSPDRTILGFDQEAWFHSELLKSSQRGAKWRLVGNQVVFSKAEVAGVIVNVDAWDGYPASRKRVMDVLEEGGVGGVVMLTGEKEANHRVVSIHTSLAFDVPSNPWDPESYNSSTGHGSKLIELVSPSVSSPSPLESVGLGFLNPLAEMILMNSEPHLKYMDLSRRGYMLLKVSGEKVRCEWWYSKMGVQVRSAKSGVKGGKWGAHEGNVEVLGAAVESEAGSERLTKTEVYPTGGG
ncbi:hypothetical protein HDV05_005022 [Chytridiales sp. JEL 0842]|nr:hypothetical protein HDV05_005022 [Chytridiales sp. JEL 0842]